MKRTVGLMIFASAIMLSSCGTTARYASSDNGQRFQDGIYGTTPSFRTKAEKELGQQAADALIEKTAVILKANNVNEIDMKAEQMSGELRDTKKKREVVVTAENGEIKEYTINTTTQGRKVV